MNVIFAAIFVIILLVVIVRTLLFIILVAAISIALFYVFPPNVVLAISVFTLLAIIVYKSK